MAPRRATIGRELSTPSNSRQARGAIQKNTRSRQSPNRYGQQHKLAAGTPAQRSSQTLEPSATDDEAEASIPQYTHSTRSTSQPNRDISARPAATDFLPQARGSTEASDLNSSRTVSELCDMPIHLSTMRELLHSHEQEIVDRLVLQLGGPNAIPAHQSRPSPQLQQHAPSNFPSLQPSLAIQKIVELESQPAQLLGEMESGQATAREPRAIGTYFPSEPPMPLAGESASSIVNSVETVFPGVERATLIQIIENRFKSTSIYRFLASQQERA